MLKVRFEAILATLRGGFISVRLMAGTDDHMMNCGITTMYVDQFASLALRPPDSELVKVECTVTEGTLDEFLKGLLATSPTAA